MRRIVYEPSLESGTFSTITENQLRQDTAMLNGIYFYSAGELWFNPVDACKGNNVKRRPLIKLIW